jgi:hypothetical protein
MKNLLLTTSMLSAANEYDEDLCRRWPRHLDSLSEGGAATVLEKAQALRGIPLNPGWKLSRIDQFIS